MKRCSHCLEEKEVSLFHKDKSKPDGYYSICKLCRKNKVEKHIPETKTCKDCRIEKRLSSFHVSHREQKGLGKYYAVCAECKNIRRYEKHRGNKRSGFLYIMMETGCGDYVKLGVLDEPYQRMKNLQTGNPRLLRIDHLIETDDMHRLETYIHRKLKGYLHRDEWFYFSSELSIIYSFRSIFGEASFQAFKKILGV